jgi:hypothetical protein
LAKIQSAAVVAMKLYIGVCTWRCIAIVMAPLPAGREAKSPLPLFSKIEVQKRTKKMVYELEGSKLCRDPL